MELFLAPLPMLYTFRNLFVFTRVCSNVDYLNNRNKYLTSKLFKQGYRYNKLRKAFCNFYYRHSELIVKYNIFLKTLLQQGVSEPVFYGDLVYKFKIIIGKPNFSDQFKNIIKRYKRVRYNILIQDVPRFPSYGVYISQFIRLARVSSNVDDFINRDLFLTAKLLKQGF